MKRIVRIFGLSVIVFCLFFPEAQACEQRSVDAFLTAKATIADYKADEPVEPDLTKRMLKNLKSNDPFKRADAVQFLGEIRDNNAKRSSPRWMMIMYMFVRMLQKPLVNSGMPGQLNR
jgi:hypothetical protein